MGIFRTTITLIVVFLLHLPEGIAVAADGDLSSEPHSCLELGGMPSEAELEEFMRTADVVLIEDIGEGITSPRRVTLKKDGRTCRAIFKTVDITSHELHYTSRLETVFTDKFVYEVAAYRIDRLLGIGLVPTTVIREIDGEIGSLQHWIENAVKMQDAVDRKLVAGDRDLLLKRLMLMYILDTVIYNIDRNFTNILVRPAGDDFFLIDHSRAFRTFKKLPQLREERQIEVPLRVARGLNELDLVTLQSKLGDLLSKKQIKAIDARRALLLDELSGRGLLPDPVSGLEEPTLQVRVSPATELPARL